MKKSLLTLSLLVFSPLFVLVSCGDNSGNNASEEATIVLKENEHAKLTCSISSLKGKKGDKGTITVTTDKDYYVKSVTQNEMFTLQEVSDNVFSFTLFEGVNEFEVSLKYVETIVSDSDIIGQSDEVINKDGELTDDVDDAPSKGSGTSLIPDYDNPYTIYFKDSAWWNSGAASTNILVFDSNDKVLSYNQTLGDMMVHLEYNAQGGFNYWKAIIDGDKAHKIQFIRTGANGFADWNARTDILELPTSPNDMYVLDDNPVRYDNANFALAEESKYDPSNDPVIEDLGTYTLYFETNSWWNEVSNETPFCYMWGDGDRKAWPGTEMTKVSENLYSIDFDTTKYLNCIFNTSNGSFQTADLKVPLTYGKDAKIIATLPETNPGNKSITVTWNEYK